VNCPASARAASGDSPTPLPGMWNARDAGRWRASRLAALIAISSDAHHGTDLRWLTLGVDQARRGWLQAGDVLNALPLRQLRKRLASTMGTRGPAT